MKSKELEERMTSLQNEMMIQYFGGFSSLLAIEQAVGRDYLSLTDRLHMLVAMMQLVDSGSDCDDYKSFSKNASTQQVAREADKDLDTLISEMREANYPESVLTIIDEVLRCVEAELSKLSGRTTRRDIFQGKTRISSLNLEDPDCVHLQQEVSTENYEELVKDAYRKDIVYGTVGTFAADTLRQEFEGNATRETRGFDMVIVDEVDYMTLDNGVQTTYLSHHHSSLRHTEQVLAGIWSMLSACRPVEMLESGEIHWLSRPQLFHKTAQSALGLPAEGILGLGVNLAFYSQKELDECLQAESEEAVDDANQMRKANSKALEKIMARIGPAEQQRLLAEVEKKLGADYSIEYYTVVDNKASLFGENLCSNVSEKKVQLLLIEKGFSCQSYLKTL
ncbi:unnamed protein product [Lampetra planeri]